MKVLDYESHKTLYQQGKQVSLPKVGEKKSQVPGRFYSLPVKFLHNEILNFSAARLSGRKKLHNGGW